MKFVGYFRLAPSDSLVDQEKAFFAYCQQHGHEPVATFVESGPPDGKPEVSFQQLLLHLRNPALWPARVAIKRLELLALDPEQRLFRLLELEGYGAPLICLDAPPDFDPLAAALGAWASLQHDQARGSKIRKAMEVRAIRARGLGKPPYGYRIGPKGNLEVVPEEAELVKLIFRSYLESGLGLRRLTQHLNGLGKETRLGNPWNMITLRDMLRNQAYTGTYFRFGVWVPNSHPAIISREVFREVRDKLGSRKPLRVQKSDNVPYLLAGLVHCGYCQNKLIGVTRRQSWVQRRTRSKKRETYRYYQCQSRANQGRCQYHTHPADLLEGMVLEQLKALGADSSPASPPRNDEPRLFPAAFRGSQEIAQRLRALDRRLRQLLRQAGRGKLDLSRLRKANAEISQEKAVLQRLVPVENAVPSGGATFGQQSEQQRASLKPLLESWDTLSFDVRRRWLFTLVQEILVLDDGITVHLWP